MKMTMVNSGLKGLITSIADIENLNETLKFLPNCSWGGNFNLVKKIIL